MNPDMNPMLPENESTTRPEDQLENADQLELETNPATETVSPDEESASESPATEPELAAVVENTEEETLSSAQEDKPDIIDAETPGETAIESEIPVSPDVPETPESVAEALPELVAEDGGEEPVAEDTTTEAPVAEDATEEPASEPAEEPSLIPVPEVSEALLNNIDSILGQEDSNELLTSASSVELIHAIDHFAQSEDVLRHIAAVGLIKRSFDALRSQADLPDELLDAFRVALANFNRKRSELQRKGDAEKLENSQKKKELLNRLREIVEKEDGTRIQEVRALQDEWKSIGHVVKDDIESLYKNYRYHLDKFYKLREMHFELLDYDRKINLQEKERLIEEAVNLIPDETSQTDAEVWREKMDLLTELQHQWKSVGHVPREEMERVNNAYRDAIDRFFDVRQSFMKEIDAEKEGNAQKKQDILAKMEAFRNFEADKPKAWNEATQTLRAYQEEWKTIGQASYALNNELWGRYREICNVFFTRKADFFRSFDDVRNVNLDLKRKLVERAEALKDSDNMETAAKELKNLQNEWKQIGPVPGRHSNKLWNRFREACDNFFESRRGHYHEVHSDEQTNLDKKKQLIETVKGLQVAEFSAPGEAVEKIKALQAEWKEIGKVPFKQKDSIWDEFRAAIDAFFDQLPFKKGEMRDNRSRNAGGAGREGRERRDSRQSRDREPRESRDSRDTRDTRDGGDKSNPLRDKIFRLRKKLQASEEKVEQYSTNIQFISRGKSGDNLRAQIQKEIDKEKRMIEDWKNELNELEDSLNNPQPKQEKAEKQKPPVETEVVVETVEEDGVAEETSPDEETEIPVVDEAIAEPEEVVEAAETASEEVPAIEEEVPAEEDKTE